MRVTPRKVLWAVVVGAFLLTIKDDIFVAFQTDPFGHTTLVELQESSPDVPMGQSVPSAGSLPSVQAILANAEPTIPLSPEEQEIHDWETLQANRKHVVAQICREVREHADVDFPPPELLFKYMSVDHVHKVITCPFQGKQTNNYKKSLSWLAQSSLRVKQKSESYLGEMPEAPPPAFLQDLAQAHNANLSSDTSGNVSLPVTAEELEFGHNYTTEQMDYMLKNYVKIMFPDHPYERLLAVYDQKFTNRSDEVGVTLGRTILRMSRPAAKWKEVTDSEIYFNEYMNFVLKKKGTISDFMIYYDMCHVCDMEWDYIGKTTTYERDATHIIKAVEGEDKITHNATAADLEQLDDKAILEHMSYNYKNVTEYEMLRLYDDFSLDMYLFDFQWPFYNLTLMREDPTKDGKYA